MTYKTKEERSAVFDMTSLYLSHGLWPITLISKKSSDST